MGVLYDKHRRYLKVTSARSENFENHVLSEDPMPFYSLMVIIADKHHLHIGAYR
ncbi:hypothetical protein phiIBB-PF7Ap39A [Pseudomonas phage phiIBB-PF7A]|uniref:Uncharacterized protein n=1 Tax=Pseudomonas phage phiIBB-PF7A TaxID=942165 RepID=E9KIH9_9CAUD|nr:hypothetical protein phiIBB-PF7Ap39A [Pseudomonas phage phiIBB-PF7A]ADV35704.1 hypothetical protein phiIBB-PF7Ap39A [Pseudomonas phage phiIBB-PF7A]